MSRVPGVPLLALFASAALLVGCHKPCDSKLYSCGFDTGSPPGDSDSTPRTISTTGGWEHVAAGYFHSCALQDGGASCWGLNDYGQVEVPSDTTGPRGAQEVAAGGVVSCDSREGGGWVVGEG